MGVGDAVGEMVVVGVAVTVGVGVAVGPLMLIIDDGRELVTKTLPVWNLAATSEAWPRPIVACPEACDLAWKVSVANLLAKV